MPTEDITIEAFFGLMLIAIQDRIAEKVPAIKWVDQDLGQLEEDTDRPRVQWPCLLVDFTETDYSEMSVMRQWGAVNLQFRLGFNPFSSAAAATPSKYRQEALKYYELEQEVYIAFQAWDAGGLCQPMTRTRGTTEKREDLFRVRVMNFTTTFEDASAVPVRSQVTRPPLSFD